MEVKKQVTVASPARDPLGELVVTRFWQSYFFLTIAILGSVLGFGICIPLYALSIWKERFRKPADTIMQLGIRFLMLIQPWLDARVELALWGDSISYGQLLVSNHRSHLDVFLLLAHIRGIRILANETLFQIPFLGSMMRASHQIPVPRKNLDGFFKAFETVRKRLQQDERVHIFPELTRCQLGTRGTLPFSVAPFHIAFQENTMIYPLVIQGTDQVWPKGVFTLRFRRAVTIRALAPLSPRHYQSSEALRDAVRGQIEQALLA